MKIITSVEKSSHQNHAPCYLRAPIFFLLQKISFSSAKEKAAVIAVFLNKLDHRPQIHCIYYNVYIIIIIYSNTILV